ncbi:MAG TPA: response regulator transcription factor, partial [Saprospiraceae bacterium]|nr:response regulator transcription factor [Saprospiraceae bacterium]
MIKVWITDDHQLVLEGLRILLDGEQEIQVAQCFRSAPQLISALKEGLPDVVLLDINMPDMNGIEACK